MVTLIMIILIQKGTLKGKAKVFFSFCGDQENFNNESDYIGDSCVMAIKECCQVRTNPYNECFKLQNLLDHCRSQGNKNQDEKCFINLKK